MDEVAELAKPVTFKVHGRALEWGFPMGVGYRYLSLPLFRAVPPEVRHGYLPSILEAASSRDG
jgi:hypothetical protein